jgi:hypothetical protein
MIALSKKVSSYCSVPAWHPGFLALVPKIREYAMFAFRRFQPESK